MRLVIVRGNRKVALLPDLPKLRGKLAPWTPLLFLRFPSVHLCGHRQATALRQRWMEVVNRRQGQKEWESKRGSQGEIYSSPHRPRQNDRWGDYGTGLLSTVIKVRKPPCTTEVEPRPITLVERGQNHTTRKYPPFQCNISLNGPEFPT